MKISIEPFRSLCITHCNIDTKQYPVVRVRVTTGNPEMSTSASGLLLAPFLFTRVNTRSDSAHFRLRLFFFLLRSLRRVLDGFRLVWMMSLGFPLLHFTSSPMKGVEPEACPGL